MLGARFLAVLAEGLAALPSDLKILGSGFFLASLALAGLADLVGGLAVLSSVFLTLPLSPHAEVAKRLFGFSSLSSLLLLSGLEALPLSLLGGLSSLANFGALSLFSSRFGS